MKNNGRILDGEERLQAGGIYRIEPRLYGGKGGTCLFIFITFI